VKRGDEGRLRRVLGLGVVPEHAPSQAVDALDMATKEGVERLPVAAAAESVDQVRVGLHSGLSFPSYRKCSRGAPSNFRKVKESGEPRRPAAV
jgi:hypothetical protein